MASKTTRRLIAIGAFAAAAAAGPALTASMVSAGAPQDFVAQPACLAWLGNQEDGNCLSYSNGNGVNLQSPQYNYCSGGAASNDGCGWSSGPLLPGYTIDQGIN